MANTKSAKKALRRNVARRQRNQATESMLKTVVKKARKSAGTEASPLDLRTAVRALDKAAQRGVIHKNQAARRKSRLAKAVSKSSA